MRHWSMFSKLFALLSGLTIIPFLLVACLFDSALLSTYQEDASKICLGRLEGAKSVGESLTESLRSTCLSVAMDPEVSQLDRWKSFESLSSDPQVLCSLWAYQNRLADTVRTNDFLESVSVRPTGVDYFVESIRGTVRLDEGDISHTQEEVPGAHWSLTNPLTYVFPLTLFVTRTKGTIEAQVDGRRLLRWINANPNDGRVSILAQSGTVFLADDRHEIGTKRQLPTDLETHPSGARIVDGVEGKVMETWLASTDSPWVYFGSFPLQSLDRGLAERRAWMSWVSVVLVALSLVLAYLASLGFLRPLADLVTEVRMRGHSAVDTDNDEISYLSRTIHRLEVARRKEVEVWILTSLEGNVAQVPEEFQWSHFRCAIVQIDGYRDFRLRHTLEEQTVWGRLWLEEISQALSGPGAMCRGVAQGEGRITIVLNGEAFEDDALVEIATGLSQRCRERCGHGLSFCWGSEVPLSQDVVQSWHVAQALTEVRFLRGWGTYFPRDLHANGESQTLPAESIHRLLVALESGRASTLEESIRRIGSQIRNHTLAGHGQARLSLYQVAAALLSWMSENALDPARVFGTDFHLQGDLETLETLSLAEEWLLLIGTHLIEAVNSDDHGSAGQIGRVLSYLREHYQEECDVTRIADAVGLSYSHLRRVFTKIVGEPISVYLNRLRIEDAKYLLRNTDLSLEEIATQVGYRNTQSLQRFFKRLGGTTPGDFRRRTHTGHGELSLAVSGREFEQPQR